jgi:hypothetical protein
MTAWQFIEKTWEFWLILFLISMIMRWAVMVATGTNRWRYDERNPYRRYCKTCGTGQELWIGAGCGRDGKWEYFLPINECKYNHEDDD